MSYVKYSATDTDIHKTYCKFKNKSNMEYASVKRKLRRLADSKEKCYQYLTARKGNIAYELSIVLDDYQIEYVAQTYNPLLSLQKTVKRLLNSNTSGEVRRDIIELNKWCSILDNETKTSINAAVLQRKVIMTFSEYQEYVSKYYCAVHKVLLDGEAYKFGHGIGTCWINRWKFSESIGKRIDFAETARRKQWLIDNGYKPHNLKEARTAEAEGREYDGIPYIVYQDFTYGYSLFFTNVKFLHTRKPYQLKKVSYIASKYRNMNYETIIRYYCKTEDSVANLQFDLFKKLHILLLMNPGRGIRFDRKYAECY